MSRARVPESLLAGLATAVVAWPVSTLFTPTTWVRPTLAIIAVVVVCGMLARLVTTSWVLVVLAQLTGVVLASGGLYGRGHLWHGLPTYDMLRTFNFLLYDARQTIQNYSAPAPTGRGVILGIGLAIAIAAIIVDHLAVMRRSPAMAGLPLLTAFLLSASNSGSSLPPVYFVAAAGIWMLMLGRQGIASLRRWSTTVPMNVTGRRANDDRDGAYGYAAVGRTLGVAGLVTALVLPVVIPHFPTRFLIDGLGRSANATGFSDGQIGLKTTLDLQKSLSNPSKSPVLTYTTNAPTLTPLRVTVLENYANDQWTPTRPDVAYGRRTSVPLPPDLDASVPRETYRISVDDSRLEAPQIAAPTPVVSGDLDRVPWGVDAKTSVAMVNRAASTYSFSYLQLRPSEAALNQAVASGSAGVRSEDLLVDPASSRLLTETVSTVVPTDANRIEAARAIQKYLRTDGGFSYSLQLPDTVTNEFGQAERPDAISLFLRTKVGYCVQFATAMVMLARAADIPARLAIGFLPGSLLQGSYTVRASDAHAWPELYFQGVGWLRFEPTPSGTQNTIAPGYSLPPTTPGSDSETATSTGGATSTPTRSSRDGANDPGSAGAITGTGDRSLFDRYLGPQTRTTLVWLALGLLVGLMGALAVPLAARSRLRRRLREAPDDARRVEVEWQAMVERIGDLGVIPPRGSTPRQAGRFFQREAYLEGEQNQALGRIVDGVERSRYARPGTTVTDIREETQLVVKAVSGVRRRKDRLRATWWPAEGVTEWRERRGALGRALRQPWERLQDRLDERREQRRDGRGR